MGRFGRSWELIKLCWGVLQQDKELVVFPIVSGIAVAIVTASFVAPGILTGYWETLAGDGQVPVSGWVLLVLFYLVEYFVIIFFNAALVSAAMVRLEGGDPTLGDGLRGAWSHIGSILGWAAISATVGLVLQALRGRGGFAGAIVAMLGGMAWNIITFLVIPVLVVEGVDPIAAHQAQRLAAQEDLGRADHRKCRHRPHLRPHRPGDRRGRHLPRRAW